jgi:hypothetical protein
VVDFARHQNPPSSASPQENDPRRAIEAALARRKDEFALSRLVVTADGYIVKFRLGAEDVVRTAVEARVFEDSSRIDRMLEGVRLTFKALSNARAVR